MGQHRRFKQQRQRLSFFRLPVNLRRRRRVFVFDADVLRDSLRRLLRGVVTRGRLRSAHLRSGAGPGHRAGERQQANKQRGHGGWWRHHGWRRHDGWRRQGIGPWFRRHAPELHKRRDQNAQHQERRDDRQKCRRAVRPAQRRPGEERPAEDQRQEFLLAQPAKNPERHCEQRQHQRAGKGDASGCSAGTLATSAASALPACCTGARNVTPFGVAVFAGSNKPRDMNQLHGGKEYRRQPDHRAEQMTRAEQVGAFAGRPAPDGEGQHG